jgi:hypothetical protein
VKWFGIKAKLAPRYISMFPILEKLGVMAYKLELSPSLVGVHDVFHVSQLKKCLNAPTDVVVNDVAPLEINLSNPEHPMKLLGQQDRVLRRRMIRFYKVKWSAILKKNPRGRTRISSFPIIRISFLRGDARL